MGSTPAGRANPSLRDPILAGRQSGALEIANGAALRRWLAIAGVALGLAFAASIAVKNERFYRADQSFAASVERDLRPRLWRRAWEEWKGKPQTAALGVIGLALLAGFLTKDITDDFFHRHNAHVFRALNGMLLGFSVPRRD